MTSWAVQQYRHVLLSLSVLLLLTSTLTASAQNTIPCNRPTNHPLLHVIEQQYGLTFADIAVWYCQGITPTAIIQILQYAALTGEDYHYYLNLLASGNWLSILLENDTKISEIAPGQGIRGSR